MDLINLTNDLTFNSGQVGIPASASFTRAGRIPTRGRRCLLSVSVVSGQLDDFAVQQSAYPDDPNPVTIASGLAGDFTHPAYSDLSYTIPGVGLPLAAGAVFQLHFQGDASEIIILANSASGATLSMSGSCIGHGS